MQFIWKEFLKAMQEQAGTQVVETWFKSVSLRQWNKETRTVTLCVPNQFVSSWIRQHYQELLKKQLCRLLDSETVNFIFECPPPPEQPRKIIPATSLPSRAQSENKHKEEIKSKDSAETNKKGGKKADAHTYENYSFNTYVVGPSNHLAYSAAYAVAKGAGREYNPLFIYGGTGLGKTHLMNCIVNESMRLRPQIRATYKSADSFVDEFIRSIRLDRIHHFREKYRKVDMLLIDDVQFFSQKEQTQEAFFHLFNALHESGKQLVLSSDTPPSEISGLQDRLRSRFGWGLIADIQAPSLETKVAILIKKASDNNVKLSNEVATAIASRVKSNVRELEGALTRLSTIAALKESPLSAEFVEQELSAASNGNGMRQKISPHEIMEAVAKHYSISTSVLRSKKRDQKTAMARQILIFLIKKYTTCSLKTIGDYVGGRNHATVLHSVAQAEKVMKGDDGIARDVGLIEREFLD